MDHARLADFIEPISHETDHVIYCNTITRVCNTGTWFKYITQEGQKQQMNSDGSYEISITQERQVLEQQMNSDGSFET